MVSIASHGAEREGYARSNQYQGDASQMVSSKKCLMDVGCNHATKNSLRASSMVKPRTRKANISIKHRSKQA